MLRRDRMHFRDVFYCFFPFNLVTSDDIDWEFHQKLQISVVILQNKNQNAYLIKCYPERDLQTVL